MAPYLPGSYFLTRVEGWAGFAIGLGQALCNAPSRYGHAGIVIGTDGATVEAMPGGAILGNLADYDRRGLLVCDGPVRDAVEAGHDERLLRRDLVVAARSLVNTPYSALDYVALGCLHWHLPSRWIRRRVQNSGHVICSQLVDLTYRRVGLSLFPDPDRLPGDVMPADLAAWAEDWYADHR